MVQTTFGLGFAEQTLLGVRSRPRRFVEELECDLAMQPDVLGQIDNAHSTRTDGRKDLIVGDGGPNHDQLAEASAV